jgi:predicted phosphodiesterase
MVDRVAVLSDVHGVLPALTAVLAEPDAQTAELIVLTGDIAAGPQPVRTLDLLLSLGSRVVWIGGNCERELVSAASVLPSRTRLRHRGARGVHTEVTGRRQRRSG